MNHQALADYIAPFLAPARRVVAELPKTGQLILNPEPFVVPVVLSARTYYLGRNGRVSQRPQLVGEIIATVRAHTTDHARYLFTEYRADRGFLVSVPKPFIGAAVLCECGWHHSKFSECPVCANWRGLAGSVQTGRVV